ncbi:hypothetical protein GJAV_G00224070 [Gymnothorax javanicus]|nr:hypothetical protein GJAV_G00224070 [Gymnothorax javanicus]
MMDSSVHTGVETSSSLNGCKDLEERETRHSICGEQNMLITVKEEKEDWEGLSVKIETEDCVKDEEVFWKEEENERDEMKEGIIADHSFVKDEIKLEFGQHEEEAEPSMFLTACAPHELSPLVSDGFLKQENRVGTSEMRTDVQTEVPLSLLPSSSENGMERRRRKKPEQDAKDHISSDKDKTIIEQRTIGASKELWRHYKEMPFKNRIELSSNRKGQRLSFGAIASEDDSIAEAAEQFERLCSSELAELISHSALAALSKSKFNKPSTIPFTRDVQLLHQYLEKKSTDAFDGLKNHESSQRYAELARVILAQIIIFNRRCADEVSKMTLECFQNRDQTELLEDIAVGLSPFEQKLSKHFSRVEIMGKRGRKVAVLLNPELVSAITLLVDKRDACEVDRKNPFLFGRPKCSPTSFYRGQDCIRVFVSQCGAQNPEYLRSAQLRKHVATVFQILNLKDNELDQLANFLGCDIRVHRDYYRLPDATTEIAKISKLLLAMEKGSLARFQGKSLEDIEIEEELEPDQELDTAEVSDDEEDLDPVLGVTGKRKSKDTIQNEGKRKVTRHKADSSRGTF